MEFVSYVVNLCLSVCDHYLLTIICMISINTFFWKETFAFSMQSHKREVGKQKHHLEWWKTITLT